MRQSHQDLRFYHPLFMMARSSRIFSSLATLLLLFTLDNNRIKSVASFATTTRSLTAATHRRRSFCVPKYETRVLNSHVKNALSFTTTRPRCPLTLEMVTKSGGTLLTTNDAFSERVLLASESEWDDDNPSASATTSDTPPTPIKPVQLVFFTAPWCGPCRLTNPVVKDVMKQFSDQMDVFEINTDELPDVAEAVGVVRVPTIQIYHDGEMREAIVGCVAKNVLAASVKKVLEEVEASP